MPSNWYVIISKLNKDEALFSQLSSQGYEVFFPKNLTFVDNAGRYQSKAYFPGYMFVRLNPATQSVSALQWMPNSEGLVVFGTKPASVPDVLVEAIKQHVYKLNQHSSIEHERQDAIESAGPKTGVGASIIKPIFLPELSGEERVKSFLHLLEGVSLSNSWREEA